MTIQDPFPTPIIDDILEKFNNAKWYTNLDLKQGYLQPRIATASIPYTGFSTADGHYEWLRVAFGLKNAPAFFNRMMFQILGDLTFVQIYLDDIFIGSESEEKYLDHISIVINRLKNAKLRIYFKKCNFFKTSIKILGHVISENNVKMDPEKIEVLKNWKTPS